MAKSKLAKRHDSMKTKKPIAKTIQISHKKKAVLVGFIAAFAYLGILFVQVAAS